MIRKEAVSKYGLRIMNAINNMDFPVLQEFGIGGQLGNNSATSGESMTINLSFPTGNAVPVQTTKQLARTLLREFEQMGWRASA